MVSISRAAKGIAILSAAVMACGLAVESAGAAGNAPEVVVPAPGGGGGGGGAPVGGCYSVDQALYGPYHMTFCVYGGQGNYRVRGAGLNCRGSLGVTWYGPTMRISLVGSFCGRGMQWTADTIDCQVMPPLGHKNWPTGQNGPNVVVPVPGGPGPGDTGALSCTYRPAVGGYPPVGISARRQ